MLLGNMTGRLGSLVDARSEEEKRREYERMTDPFGTKKGRAMQEAIGNEAPKQPGFWQGGDKFTGRDALAGIMAAIGDALSQQSGGQGVGAAASLAGGRTSAINMAKKQQAQQAQIQQDAQILMRAGYSPEQAIAMATGNLKPSDVKGPEPTAAQRNTEWWMKATDEQKSAFDKVNPIINNGPYGQQVIPRSSLPGAGQKYDPNEWEDIPDPRMGGGSGFAPMRGGAPPLMAVQALRANPSLASDFDAQFGPGASARFLGGAGPSQAPRGFR